MAATIHGVANRAMSRPFMVVLVPGAMLVAMDARPRHLESTVLSALLAAALLLPAAPGPAAATDDGRRAREAVQSGRHVGLEAILEDALRRFPGRVLDAELDDDEYEVEILTLDGRKIELEYDARTGRLLEVDVDD